MAVLVELGHVYGPEEGDRASSSQFLSGPDESTPRYRIDGLLGAGGMGVVYRGYDRRLERPVAIKGLHPAAADARGLLVRLRKEAQRMARVNHPNVVEVLDVSLVHDEIFVVMELVEGASVRQWLRHRPRSISEVLDVFIAAGRGLAAAHQAGLVHRDFKPDNVLVGADGRVRVADFGLAYHAKAGASSTRERESAEGEQTRLSARIITSQAEIVGTAAYMAPEQRSGGPVDHRADQYAFAVSLHEALTGERPEADPRGTLSTRRVPRAVVQALRRALAQDPAARWLDMPQMLKALCRRVSPERWRLAGAGVLVAVLAWGVTRHEPTVVECPTAPTRAPFDVRRAHARLVRHVGAELAAHTAARLEAQAERLGALERALCESSGDVVLRRARQVCLAEHWAELGAMLDALEQLEGEMLYEAAEAVMYLTESTGCQRPVPRMWPRDEQRIVVEDVRQRLARARGLRRAGRPSQAERELEEAADRLRGIDFEPVWAELLLDRGRLHRSRNRWAEASEDLEQSYWAAMRVDAFALAAEAAAELVMAHLDDGASLAEVDGWIRHGQAAHDRAGDDADPFMLETARGRLEAAQGHDALAVPHFERALAMAEARYGTEHPTYWSALQNLGIASDGVGEYGRAVELATIACDGRRASLGPDHPAVARCLRVIANAEARTGALETAVEHLRRAVEIVERIHGSDDLELVSYLDSLSVQLGEQGRHAEAVELQRRSVAILDAKLGPAHLETARSRRQLGNTLRRMGRVEEGQALLADVRAILEANVAEDHPMRVALLNDLANLAIVQDRPDEAEPLLREAFELYERRYPDGHPSTAVTLLQLGHVAGQRGRPDEALERFEQADAMLVATAGSRSPNRWAVLAAKTDTLFELRRDAEAEAVCREALASMGDHGPVSGPWRRLGELALVAGRDEEALAALGRSWQGADAQDDAHARAHAELLRAHVLLRAGRARESQEALARAQAVPEVDHEDLRARVERVLERAAGPSPSLTWPGREAAAPG